MMADGSFGRGRSGNGENNDSFSTESCRVERLDYYYDIIHRQILKYQSLPHGLFPRNISDVNDNPEGHVRDNVYCALSIWSLALAYRHVDNDQGRTHELEHSAVKCMRGILFFYMRQSHKVEAFKYNQEANNSLHCKFDINTTDKTSDASYPNLQIDVVSLYLLVMSEMIASGLNIIFTTDEVNFIQNLVYYVERTYRTADYGMWERGTRYHNGSRELNASSIGMSKAALEAINGFNIFGGRGVSSWSVIYVDPDAHNRNNSIFSTLLPRESNSKNTDAALLTIAGFPSFAIDDENLRNETREKVIRYLQGRYGCKRFRRDGYGTVLENKDIKGYERSELQGFAGIECEWPIFFAYLALDAIFQGDLDGGGYLDLLEPLMIYTKDGKIMPKYYYVPPQNLKQELENPGSMQRYPNEGYEENIFLWGQSLYIMANILREGLVSVDEIDPLGRSSYGRAKFKYGLVNKRYSSFRVVGSDLVVQICLISENRNLQANLATYGIETQTPKEIEPIVICPPGDLIKIYAELGFNRKLQLTGRPPRPIGSLGTSKVYRILGRTVVTYPILLDEKDFYMSLDMSLLIDNIKNCISFVRQKWNMRGRPIVCLYLRDHNFRGQHASEMVDFMAQLKTGEVNGVKVKLGRMQTLISTGCVEHLDFLKPKHGITINTITNEEEPDYLAPTGFESVYQPHVYSEFEDEESERAHRMHSPTHELAELYMKVSNLQQQMCILDIIKRREGPAYTINNMSVTDGMNDIYTKACHVHNWSVVRYGASLLGKSVDSLAPSITSMLVSGKQVGLGVFGHEEIIISEPLTPAAIQKIIFDCIMPVRVSDVVLQQELIIYLGKIIETQKELFKGMMRIRVGWIIEAMKNRLEACEPDENGEKPGTIYSLYPSSVKQLLMAVLAGRGNVYQFDITPKNMIEKRQLDGALNRVPPSFYKKVWYILNRVSAGIKFHEHLLPQQPIITEMTMDEADFKLRVEDLLGQVNCPVDRQIAVELIMVVAAILERNPEVEIRKSVNVSELMSEAMNLHRNNVTNEGESDFYNLDSGWMMTYLSRAVVNKVLQDSIVSCTDADNCKVS